jgi:hypothetical protein
METFLEILDTSVRFCEFSIDFHALFLRARKITEKNILDTEVYKESKRSK